MTWPEWDATKLGKSWDAVTSEGHITAEPIVSHETGEVIVESDVLLDEEAMKSWKKARSSTAQDWWK